ncbi:hypothetical protein BC941DRAFT_418757 [Chlamydoabsidia padenii]|nr:hypothetical protein BC941DRAFT_418757 [Chlamydoabsidia padenii]
MACFAGGWSRWRIAKRIFPTSANDKLFLNKLFFYNLFSNNLFNNNNNNNNFSRIYHSSTSTDNNNKIKTINVGYYRCRQHLANLRRTSSPSSSSSDNTSDGNTTLLPGISGTSSDNISNGNTTAMDIIPSRPRPLTEDEDGHTAPAHRGGLGGARRGGGGGAHNSDNGTDATRINEA